jgi:hypothetical protein
MYQFLDVEEFSPVRVIATVAKSYLHSPTPLFSQQSHGRALELVSRDDNNITVADITQLYVGKEDNLELLHRAAQLEALPKSWRDYFQR